MTEPTEVLLNTKTTQKLAREAYACHDNYLAPYSLPTLKAQLSGLPLATMAVVALPLLIGTFIPPVRDTVLHFLTQDELHTAATVAFFTIPVMAATHFANKKSKLFADNISAATAADADMALEHGEVRNLREVAGLQKARVRLLHELKFTRQHREKAGELEAFCDKSAMNDDQKRRMRNREQLDESSFYIDQIEQSEIKLRRILQVGKASGLDPHMTVEARVRGVEMFDRPLSPTMLPPIPTR